MTKTATLTRMRPTVTHANPRPGRLSSPSGSMAFLSSWAGAQRAPFFDRFPDRHEGDGREHGVNVRQRDPARLRRLVIGLGDDLRVDRHRGVGEDDGIALAAGVRA